MNCRSLAHDDDAPSIFDAHQSLMACAAYSARVTGGPVSVQQANFKFSRFRFPYT